ncbi:GTPase, G3E family [Nitratireductor aquibiodomus]|uniref:GTPase, G3E family n=1 Tax=Nitratireductor aquibiodomus TaxID=204799 RepID=A0A1H4JT20_9HYPH|nr:GTP-binding protein [Nitratireductor aquibiodomus]SEB49409.1 GTPase, G3E family [Nitratireductor aquibiodomus]
MPEVRNNAEKPVDRAEQHSRETVHRSRIPVFILTGFLGAGKSTLLNSVLRDPAFARTAVIVNEFGDVALDHDLVSIGQTQVARTTTGCMCCTFGSNVRAGLHDLHTLAAAGEVSFERVIVETTGLADPAPIINDLIPGGSPAVGLRDHVVARTFELAGVVTLVDVMTGATSIENHFEATKQVAFADRIVLTKTDLLPDPGPSPDVESLTAMLAKLNPSAPIEDRMATGFAQGRLFDPRAYVPASLGDDVTGWLALDEALRAENANAPSSGHDDRDGIDRHGGRIRAFTLTRDDPIEQVALDKFMTLISAAAGPRLLRVKGLVNLMEDPGRPRVIHAVQHVVYPTLLLEAWPSDDHRTRLVFITDGVDPKPVRQLFDAALDNRLSRIRRLLAEMGEGLSQALRLSASRMTRNAS